ncbi:MAG: adenylyl-sulfate kinase, partial [Rhodospirillales bacterium]|nr:adenylyl-sulfate kinase [Rhodospirillales bacterium]
DPKGLYVKARKGDIPDFTGISAPYEAPEQPELEIDTAKLTVEESLEILFRYVEKTFKCPG